MSELQQQAIRLISGLSDENISYLIEIIQRMMPQKAYEADTHSVNESIGMEAFKRLDALTVKRVCHYARIAAVGYSFN